MNIEHIANHINSLVGVAITLFKPTQKKITFQQYYAPTSVDEIITENRLQLKENTGLGSIYRLQDYSELCYFSFQVQEDVIVVGPYLEKEASPSTIRGLSARLRLLNENRLILESFYDSLPVFNTEETDFIFQLVHHLSTVMPMPTSYITLKAKEVRVSRKLSLDTLFEELEYVRHNYQIEDEFTSLIIRGDVEKATIFDTSEIMKQLPKRAINDSLRNAKTRLTILNTLCNRAAIKGGIDVQLGHQISTNFGITIEGMKSILDSDKLSKEIIIEYATAVKNYSLQNYSKLLQKAILYIRRNITYHYTLQDLSNDLYVSKEHLSRLFKKETGTTVSAYINNAKVIEAKRLLDSTEYSIQEISSSLGYTNSTYFSTVFKKLTSYTPIQYKKHMYKKTL